MTRISAVLISLNEEQKIGRALASLVGVADEIIVVDSNSTDRTSEICRKFDTVFIRRGWSGYREQKQFATNQATHDWVLNLDCDEELGPGLRRELIAWKTKSHEEIGYYIPRLTWFMGTWIRHTSWSPDLKMRLFRRDRGSWEGGRVHESFTVDGPAGQFQNPILHYTYQDFSEYLRQLDRFSTLSAKDARDRGKRFSRAKLVISPALVFFKDYFLKRGFMDGLPGFAVGLLSATATIFKLLKLWELENSQTLSPQKLEADNAEVK